MGDRYSPSDCAGNSARLRITLTASHELEDVKQLVTAIRRVLNEY